MNKFTLRVIDDRASGNLMPDIKSDQGGLDLLQPHAFRHLFPEGFCSWMFRQLLYDMAALHGWDVSVTEHPIPTLDESRHQNSPH